MTTQQFRQQGLGLVEILVGLAIALFLLSGLAAIFVALLQSAKTRDAISDLQQRQLLAATILSKTIQQSGYYPDPTASTPELALPAGGEFAAGQGLFGTDNTITSRFVAPPNDNAQSVINCQGGSNSSNNSVTYINTFDIRDGNLRCALNNTTSQPLVGGIKSMHLLYGVDTNFGSPNDPMSVTSYVKANDVAANGGWSAVKNVKITLCFDNPVSNLEVPEREPCGVNQIPFTFFVNLIGQGQT